MIGDGVNDVLFLKVVDVGILMGSGLDVVMEVVDMVFFDSFLFVIVVV